MLKKLLFLIALLTPSVVQAEGMLVRVVILRHPSWPNGYVSMNTVYNSVGLAQALHRLHGGPEFVIKDYRIKQDPAPRFHNLGQQVTRLSAIRASKLHRQMRRNVDMVYYVVSPQNSGTTAWFMGGVASGFCQKHGRSALAIGQMRDFNDFGAPRASFSTVIMAHEIGHIIGMYHVPSNTLMHEAALSFLPNNLAWGWDQRNIEQARSCK